MYVAAGWSFTGKQCLCLKQEYGREDVVGSDRLVCGAAVLQGIPCVQAVGEGEATCAALNAAGWAQGCATSDVDALLFGAVTVYRQLHLQVMRGQRGG
jgi:hypothetical protein